MARSFGCCPVLQLPGVKEKLKATRSIALMEVVLGRSTTEEQQEAELIMIQKKAHSVQFCLVIGMSPSFHKRLTINTISIDRALRLGLRRKLSVLVA